MLGIGAENGAYSMTCNTAGGSAAPDGVNGTAQRVVVRLRIDDSLRLQLRSQIGSADPFPDSCAFRAEASFGEVHAYVRRQLAAAAARHSDDVAAAASAQQALPITYLDVVCGGGEVTPAPESTLASLSSVVNSHISGTLHAEGRTVTVNVRGHVFNG